MESGIGPQHVSALPTKLSAPTQIPNVFILRYNFFCHLLTKGLLDKKVEKRGEGIGNHP